MNARTLAAAAGRTIAAGNAARTAAGAAAPTAMTVDEIIREIDALPDAERDDLLERLGVTEDGTTEPVDDEENVDTPAAGANPDDDEEDTPAAENGPDDDEEKPAAALPYGRVRAMVAKHLDGDVLNACVVACLDAGVTDAEGVMDHVAAALKKQAAPDPGASDAPIGRGRAIGGGRRRRGDGGAGPKQAAFMAAVDAHKREHGCTRREAIRAVVREQPELHAAYMREIGRMVRA